MSQTKTAWEGIIIQFVRAFTNEKIFSFDILIRLHLSKATDYCLQHKYQCHITKCS
jgi:hypothetical protein